MMKRILLVAALLVACGESGGAAPTASGSAQLDRRAVHEKAQAAFPDGALPTCTEPVA